MVKIRLRRMGAKKAPYYRIVVADSRSPRDGRFIEEIGTYDPLSETKLPARRHRARQLLDRQRCPADRHRQGPAQEGSGPDSKVRRMLPKEHY